MVQSVAPGSPPDDPVRGLGPCSSPPRMIPSGASFRRILSVASGAPVRGTWFTPGRSNLGASAVLHSAPVAPIWGVFLSYSLRCLGCSSASYRVLHQTIQSGGLGRAPLRPGCSNPGRLFIVFSPLPQTLQSVAPGSAPDDPVRGLVPCFIPPRLLQSGASFFPFLSVTSDAPVRGTGFTPGRSNPGASAVLHLLIPGRLFIVFSPLPWMLQSVAPGSATDDPVRGLGSCSTPPEMHQPWASFSRILSVASDAPVRGSGLTPGRSSLGARAELHSAPDAPIRGVTFLTLFAVFAGVCVLGAFFFARPSSLLPPRSPPLRCPWHLVPCRGSSCVVHASRVRGTRWPSWLGTCPGAVVVAGGVPLWRASWPCVGAPLLVRSGRCRCSVRPSRRRGAFPHPGGCRPRLYWMAARGTWRPAENRALVPAAGPCRGKGAGRAPRRTRSGPRDGVVPGGSLRLRSWAACAAVVWRVRTRSLTRPVSRTVRLATGDSAGSPGLSRVDADTAPFGSEDATPRSRACVRVRVRALLRRVGWAGLPGAFWCASPLLWPFLVRSLLVRPPPGWGCPVCGCCPVFFLFSFSPSPPSLRHRCVLLCVFSGPGCLGPWHLLPPPLFFFWPPPLLSLAFLCFPVARGLCAPPPPCFFPFFLCFLFFPFPFFFFYRLCGAGRVCVSLAVGCARVCLGGAVPVVALGALAGVAWCSLLGLAVLCCLLVGLGVVLRWCGPCLAAWLVDLLFGVVCLGVPLPCVVLPCAVLSCGGVLSCSAVCLRRCLRPLFVSCRCASAVCVLGCRAVYSLSSPPCAVLCCAVLVPFRCAVRVVCAVSGGWCRWFLVSLPFVGGLLVALVARRCRLVVCVGFGARVRSGRRWASSLWCPASLCCVLWRSTALWCCAVVPCPLFFFFPCWWRWFPVVPCWFWAPGQFRVVSVSVLCPCGAVLVCLRRCSLFGALLPSRGWLVFCVVACRVCVFAVGPGCPLLSPGGSWWLPVSCLGGVLWCVPGCCAAPCCCALSRLALRCCALCCFVLLRFVLPRAVLCPGALSVVLGSCALWRRVLSCPLALCVFCCGVSLRGVVRRCALCRVRPGVSCCAFPVVSALCGVAV